MRFSVYCITCHVSILLAAAACISMTTTAADTRPLDAVGQIAANLEPTQKIVYKTVGDQELRLHVFEPDGFKPADRRACFLIIHGGGWRGMSPRRMYPFAAHLTRLGMVGVCPEYRLVRPNSGVSVFDCVRDSRSSVRYVRRHAATLGIDPERMVVAGASAGGHLAAGTALFDGVDEPGEDTSVSCMPSVLVLLFPVIDTSAEGYGNALLGDRWRELSPLHQVRPGMPPTILFHGAADTTTPFAGAKAFHQAMLAAGNRCEFVVTEGGAHGYIMRSRPVYEETMKTIEKYLGGLGMLGASPGDARQ